MNMLVRARRRSPGPGTALCGVVVVSLLLLGLPGQAAQAAGLPRWGQVSLVSRTTAGIQANDQSFSASVSGDGGRVAFLSYATNLVAGAGPGPNAYLRDRGTGRVLQVNPAGTVAVDPPTVSADGSVVLVAARPANRRTAPAQVYLRRVATGAVSQVSLSSAGQPADGDSRAAVVSRDGSLVAFTSFAGNLVPAVAGGIGHVYLRDLRAGSTRLADRFGTGAVPTAVGDSPVLSADGRFLAFATAAALQRTDRDGVSDTYLLDLTTGRSAVIGAANRPTSPAAIAADGSTLVNLVVGTRQRQVEVIDLRTGATLLTIAGPVAVGPGSLSADGRWLATVVAEQVLVRDLSGGGVYRADVDRAGAAGNDAAAGAAISADGHSVVFDSRADNLVAGDPPIGLDVFVAARAS